MTEWVSRLDWLNQSTIESSDLKKGRKIVETTEEYLILKGLCVNVLKHTNVS